MNKSRRLNQEQNYFKFRLSDSDEHKFVNLPLYIKKYLPENSKLKILDIGCGFGGYIQSLLSLGYQYVEGIDISEEAYLYGKENNLTIMKIDDICNFYPTEKYDLIIMNHVLEHIDKELIITTLTHIKDNILSKSGLGFIVVPNAQSNTGSYWAYEDFTHSLLFTSGSLSYVLKSAGFANFKFIDIDGLDGTNGINKLFKVFFLHFYKLNKWFWNRITSSAFHKQSQPIFTFEIKVMIKNED